MISLGRFYVAGQDPKPIVVNPVNQRVCVRIWQTSVEESSQGVSTNTYIHNNRAFCSLSKGIPLPEGGTILKLTLEPQQTIFAVSDDIGRGAYVIDFITKDEE